MKTEIPKKTPLPERGVVRVRVRKRCFRELCQCLDIIAIQFTERKQKMNNLYPVEIVADRVLISVNTHFDPISCSDYKVYMDVSKIHESKIFMIIVNQEQTKSQVFDLRDWTISNSIVLATLKKLKEECFYRMFNEGFDSLNTLQKRLLELPIFSRSVV